MSKLTKKSRRRAGRKNRNRRLSAEPLESRLLLAADVFAKQNVAFPSDINDDNVLTPGDALATINFLNYVSFSGAAGEGEDPGFQPDQRYFYDADGNGDVTPADALQVINDLNAEGEGEAVAQYSLRAFDADGENEIDRVSVGQDFVLKAFVEDIRTSAGRAGVFSAYFDVLYDSGLVSVVEDAFMQLNPVTFVVEPVTFFHNSSEYGNGRSGNTDTSGVLDVVGSFSGRTAPVGPGEFFLWQVKMRADAEGKVNFTGEPTTEADDPGDEGQSTKFDTLLFNRSEPACPSDDVDPDTGEETCIGMLMFVNDMVTIVTDVTAVNDAAAMDEDDGFIDIDVLGNDTVQNPPGGTPVLVGDPGDAANGTTSANNDGTIRYEPDLNFNGTDTFTYVVSNGQGTEATGTVTVTVNAVNDAPTIESVPGTTTTDEDVTLELFNGTSFVVDDVDADAGSGLLVTLSVNDGVLGVNGAGSAAVIDNNSASVRISGSVSDVNAKLGTLTYTPELNFNGSDTLTLSVSDEGNTGSGGELTASTSLDLTINPINDAPEITTADPLTVFEDETISITGISVSDVEASDLSVSLSVGDGTLTLSTTSGLTVDGDGTTSISVSGPISALNNALDGLVYDPDPDFLGDDPISITANDNGVAGGGGPQETTATQALASIPRANPFARPDTAEMDEGDASVTIDVLSNDLVPANSTLSITRVNGELASNGTFSTDHGTVTLNGVLTYSPSDVNFFGSDSFTYTIESTPDAGNGASTGTVSITVNPINDAPVISGETDTVVDEDTELSLSGLSVSDLDGDVTVHLDVSVNNGTLNGTSQSSLSFSGTISEVNTELGSLTYQGNLHYNGSDTLTVTVDDLGNVGGGSLTDMVEIDLTINPVNDGPVLVLPSSPQTFITDFDNDITGISISDVDAGSADVEVNLSVNQGTLTLLDTSNVNVAVNGSVKITGTVDNINNALGGGVRYETSTEGDVTIDVSVSDLGNTGSGGALTDSGTITGEAITFIPSQIGGRVFFDDGDGIPEPGEEGLQGVQLTLTGTDFRGMSVSEPIVTDAQGNFLHGNIKPGTYSLQLDEQPANTRDGVETSVGPHGLTFDANGVGTIEIGDLGDVKSLNNYFGINGLTVPFITMLNLVDAARGQDWIVFSNNQDSGWTGLFEGDIDDPDDDNDPYNDWEGFHSPSLTLSDDFFNNDADPADRTAKLTIKYQKNGSEQTITRTYRRESGRVITRTHEGNSVMILRVNQDDLLSGNGAVNDLTQAGQQDHSQYRDDVDRVMAQMYA